LYRVWRFAQNVQREIERPLLPDAELSTLCAEWEENNFCGKDERGLARLERPLAQARRVCDLR
jgi:hypothetical protein